MLEDFIAKQIHFTANLREPDRYPMPADVNPQAMVLYQHLIYQNIDYLLKQAFPVLCSTQSIRAWEELVRDFISKHKCKRPTHDEVAEEFLHYLSYVRQRPTDPAWMYELAHYEWLELSLELSPLCLADIPHQYNGNLLNEIPVLSPLAWIQVYQYPVHSITPSYHPDSPGESPTYIIVYRNWQDIVEFMLINDFTHTLLSFINQENTCLTGRDILDSLVSITAHPNPAMVIQGGSLLLEDLRERHIILGTKPC
jgi:hypothetical protein